MKKINIGIFTTARSEFGILLPLLKRLQKNKKFIPKLFVGGTHYLKSFGKTVNEINLNKININGRFDFEKKSSTNFNTSINLSKSTFKIGKIFNNTNLDYTCFVGDRFELIPIVTNSIINKIPIIHIGGGETTLGAIDDQVRNMISKASYLHFTNSKAYSKKLAEMGENSKNIFNVGSPAIDNIKNLKKISKKEIFKKLKLDINKKTILLTYHPETLQSNFTSSHILKNLFKALNHYDFQTVITSPGYDLGSEEIKKNIFKKIKEKINYFYFDSLGFVNYHNILPHCEFIIGNSSSGIIEVPFHKVPTINIGSRQKGRLRHKSIIDVGYSFLEIKKAIDKTMNKRFRKKLSKMKYKFGNGDSCKKIEKIILKKHRLNKGNVK